MAIESGPSLDVALNALFAGEWERADVLFAAVQLTGSVDPAITVQCSLGRAECAHQQGQPAQEMLALALQTCREWAVDAGQSADDCTRLRWLSATVAKQCQLLWMPQSKYTEALSGVEDVLGALDECSDPDQVGTLQQMFSVISPVF